MRLLCRITKLCLKADDVDSEMTVADKEQAQLMPLMQEIGSLLQNRIFQTLEHASVGDLCDHIALLLRDDDKNEQLDDALPDVAVFLNELAKRLPRNMSTIVGASRYVFTGKEACFLTSLAI